LQREERERQRERAILLRACCVIRYIEDNRFPFFCVFDYHVVDEINLSKDTYAECPILWRVRS